MQQWQRRMLLTLVLLPLLPSLLMAGGEPLPQVTTAPAPAVQYRLKPFKAYYQAQFDVGMNVSGEAIRELKALPDNQWQLSLRASTMMASIEESSRFELVQQKLRPLQYSYQRKVFGKKKQAEQIFNWKLGSITSRFKERTATLPINQTTLDNVSYQIQLWHDLKGGANEMRYSLVDNDHLKALDFDRVEEELIDTPAGQYSTIKVIRDRGEDSVRKTTLWFAKEFDHLLVKLEQLETDGKRYTLLLQRLETP